MARSSDWQSKQEDQGSHERDSTSENVGQIQFHPWCYFDLLVWMVDSKGSQHVPILLHTLDVTTLDLPILWLFSHQIWALSFGLLLFCQFECCFANCLLSGQYGMVQS